MARESQMNDWTAHKTLEDVLDAFLVATSEPDSDSLSELIRRYPQYERELTEFAVAWSRSRWLPPAPGPAISTDTVISRGMSIVRDLLSQDRMREDTSALPKPTSIWYTRDPACSTEGRARPPDTALDCNGSLRAMCNP